MPWWFLFFPKNFLNFFLESVSLYNYNYFNRNFFLNKGDINEIKLHCKHLQNGTQLPSTWPVLLLLCNTLGLKLSHQNYRYLKLERTLQRKFHNDLPKSTLAKYNRLSRDHQQLKRSLKAGIHTTVYHLTALCMLIHINLLQTFWV